MTTEYIEPSQVLDFWFSAHARPLWFVKDKAFDQEIRQKFAHAYNHAKHGELNHWESDGNSCLALIILLDQVPRNIFRGDGHSFATDHLALDLARFALNQKYDLDRDDDEKAFFYLPFEHSESLKDQELSVSLFESRVLSNKLYLDYAKLHLEIIKKFGRFPHRNDVLGRKSTKAELEFLGSEANIFK